MHAHIEKEAAFGALTANATSALNNFRKANRFGSLANKAVKVVRNATGDTTAKRTAAKLSQAKLRVNDSVTNLVKNLGDRSYTSAATKTLGTDMKRRRRLGSLRVKQIMAKV